MTLQDHDTIVELTDEPRFAARVRRLVTVSSVALGVVVVLAVATTGAPGWVIAMLVGGWILMPATLAASLVRPHLRYGLILPASLVIVGSIAICWAWLPGSTVAAVGWVLITTGVAGGGLLGSWFWYRMAPVPHSMKDPFSAPRLVFISFHVGLIGAGVVMILWSLL